MTSATIIRLADRSPAHRDRALAAHQADLLLTPYRSCLAIMLAGFGLWCAGMAHSRLTFGLAPVQPLNSALLALGPYSAVTRGDTP